MPYEVHAKLYGAEEMGPEACKEAMFLIGSEAGIERKYVNPSRKGHPAADGRLYFHLLQHFRL